MSHIRAIEEKQAALAHLAQLRDGAFAVGVFQTDTPRDSVSNEEPSFLVNKKAQCNHSRC